MSIIKIKDISKSYGKHQIFNGFNAEFEDNQITAIVGKSGSGKTTLLNIIGLLEPFDSGELILFNEKNIKVNSRTARKMLRYKIGYLFQSYALIEEKTVEYNLKIVGKEANRVSIQEALAKVGLSGYEKKRILECSGGEQQRVAIARLLLKKCELILADEPTGSLDKSNRNIVIELLRMLQKEGKVNF